MAKLPPPKRLKPPSFKTVDGEEGWWFIDPNNGNYETGPYADKKTADIARKDMYLNYQINWKISGPIMLGVEDAKFKKR